MYVRISVTRPLPQHRDRYLKILQEEAIAANRDEPNTANYHVLLGDPDDSILVIYEVFKDRSGFPEHQQSPHYKKFTALVQGMGQNLSERILKLEAKSLVPSDKDWR